MSGYDFDPDNYDALHVRNSENYTGTKGRSCEIEEMQGARVLGVKQIEDARIAFHTDKGWFYLYHMQDCCESVTIEDVVGDLQDLVGHVIVVAEERTNEDSKPDEWSDSWTWTFYLFRTGQTDVTVRWLGESNGYYSESVNVWFEPLDKQA